MMELFVILGLFLGITVLMPWFNSFAIGGLRREIRRLQEEVSLLRAASNPQAKAAQPLKEPAEAIYVHRPVQMPPDFGKPRAEEPAPADLPHVPRWQQPIYEEQDKEFAAPVYADPVPKSEKGLEFNFGAKLPVWIGAISLICAAFFLVKYSFESGLLNPTTRVTLGMLFGIALTSAGHFIVRRPHIANYERIAQGLCGAGIVCLYVCLYGAVNLYNLLSTTTGFIGMSAVTATAVVASLRIGQPIAVFGLIGGLITPALMSSSEPNSTVLFIYLFVLFSGLSFITARRGWWMLLLACLLGNFMWTAIWMTTAFNPAETFQMMLLQIGLLVMALFATRRFMLDTDHDQACHIHAHTLNNIAVAGIAATIFFLNTKIPLGLFDWSVLGLLGLATITLTYFRPALYAYTALGIMGLNIALFYVWGRAADLGQAHAVLAGLVFLYALLPHLLLRKVEDPRIYAALQLVSAGCLYVISYNIFPYGDRVWAAAALLLAAACAGQVQMFYRNYLRDEEIQNILIGAYSFAASAFLSIGFTILLPESYLPVAFALQTLATVWIFGHTRIYILNFVVAILAAVFLFLSFEEILYFWNLILSSMTDQLFPPALGRQFPDDLILPLAMPGVCFLGAAYLAFKHRIDKNALLHLLACLGGTCVLALSYYLIRMGYNGNDLGQTAGFIERATISFMIAAWGLLVLRFAPDELKTWGRFLVALFLARIIWFDLMIDNPYLDSNERVGTWPVFNGITLVYLGSLIFILRLIKSGGAALGDIAVKFYSVLSCVLLMAFVSLTVRHAYHGETLSRFEPTSPLELYTYSITWLLIGLALLAYGMMYRNSHARMASFAVIGLTILKVFLVDAANLEGLYRVFSFLGLGISLMGLSYFYTRFIKAAPEER